jgi:hypothetical protein
MAIFSWMIFTRITGIAIKLRTIKRWMFRVDATGATNVLAGSVGRDEVFYMVNVPLNSGTNFFTLTATDVATNVATTSINVIQGSVGLAIDPIAPNQATVTGEIGSNGYPVSVNGIMATVSSSPNGNGVYTWEADNVPMPPNNSLVKAAAMPGSGSTGCENAAAVANNSGIYVSAYVYARWKNTICSTTNNFWHFEVGWKNGQSPPINPANLHFRQIPSFHHRDVLMRSQLI